MQSSTVIAISTTPVEILSPNTAWAQSGAASLNSPFYLTVENLSAIPVMIGGSSVSAAVGYTLTSNGLPGSSITLPFCRPDSLWAFTSASTASVVVTGVRTLQRSKMVMDGTAATSATSPANGVFDIVGDIDLRARVAVANWQTSSAPFIAKEQDGTSRSYRFGMNGADSLRFLFALDGATIIDVTSSAPTLIPQGMWMWVRATRESSSGNVRFFTAAANLDNPQSSDFVQLGTTQTSTAGPLFVSASMLEVGSLFGGTLLNLSGRMYEAVVMRGINGTVVGNPKFYLQTPGTSAFFDSVGRRWTLAGNAVIT